MAFSYCGAGPSVANNTVELASNKNNAQATFLLILSSREYLICNLVLLFSELASVFLYPCAHRRICDAHTDRDTRIDNRLFDGQAIIAESDAAQLEIKNQPFLTPNIVTPNRKIKLPRRLAMNNVPRTVDGWSVTIIYRPFAHFSP